MTTIFDFPTGIDEFDPELVNDVTIVNADHINDLRKSIETIQKALVNNNDGYLIFNDIFQISPEDSFKQAIEKLDTFLKLINDDTKSDSSRTRLDQLQEEFENHRSLSGSPDGYDGYGFSIHGAVGEVVGTKNNQLLENKILDTGKTFDGPKVIIRSKHSSDDLDNQVEILDSNNNIVASIDGLGNAKFNTLTYNTTDIIDARIVAEQFQVDGYAIIGRDGYSDFLDVNADTTMKGDLVLDGNFTQKNGFFDIVSESVSINSSSNVNIDSSIISLSGNVILENNVNILGNTQIGSSNLNQLNIISEVQIDSDVEIHGRLDIENDNEVRLISQTLNITNDVTTIDTDSLNINIRSHQLVLDSSLIINEECIIEKDLTVFGNLIFDKVLDVRDGLLCTGDAFFHDNVLVEGDGYFDDLYIKGIHIPTPKHYRQEISNSFPIFQTFYHGFNEFPSSKNLYYKVGTKYYLLDNGNHIKDLDENNITISSIGLDLNNDNKIILILNN